MPREHRELLQWVETSTPVVNSVEGRHEALEALKRFRSLHLNIVGRAIYSHADTKPILYDRYWWNTIYAILEKCKS
ncbi:hypothetical protein OESDEN_00215 [Oesophagostomum dentatum]|uniref:Uncharacterized protein n=1 Tax=Oesophagostomum dentatum TaxID=61180 RepID=A0A0B1TRB8_OESDE|nr:hypothetical protein OESDEN_00215 [Oesophagostomum dentatum]